MSALEFAEAPCVCEADLSPDDVIPAACHEDCYWRYTAHMREQERKATIARCYEAAWYALTLARRYAHKGMRSELAGVVKRVRDLRGVVSRQREATRRERASVALGEREAARVAAEAWGL